MCLYCGTRKIEVRRIHDEIYRLGYQSAARDIVSLDIRSSSSLQPTMVLSIPPSTSLRYTAILCFVLFFFHGAETFLVGPSQWGASSFKVSRSLGQKRTSCMDMRIQEQEERAKERNGGCSGGILCSRKDVLRSVRFSSCLRYLARRITLLGTGCLVLTHHGPENPNMSRPLIHHLPNSTLWG